MSSFHYNNDRMVTHEPLMTRKDYIAPILINMYNEQCDHVHSRFCESFAKVSFLIILMFRKITKFLLLSVSSSCR